VLGRSADDADADARRGRFRSSATGTVQPVGLLLTFLTGAAITLAVQLVVQLWVVPKVESRKRREDRWERNVLELGEILTTEVSRRAEGARIAQSTFRFLHQLPNDTPGVDRAKLERQRQEQNRKAYLSTEEFQDIVNTRVDWLVDRICSFEPHILVLSQLNFAFRGYWVHAMGPSVPERDNRVDSAFEDDWNQERDARKALLEQVKRLANLPHPPRTPLRRRLMNFRQRAWRWLKGPLAQTGAWLDDRWHRAWAWLEGRWSRAWAWLRRR
jgi:hypothetical protein